MHSPSKIHSPSQRRMERAVSITENEGMEMIDGIRHTRIKVLGCVCTDRASCMGVVQCGREQTGSRHCLECRQWVRGTAVEQKRSPVT